MRNLKTIEPKKENRKGQGACLEGEGHIVKRHHSSNSNPLDSSCKYEWIGSASINGNGRRSTCVIINLYVSS